MNIFHRKIFSSRKYFVARNILPQIFTTKNFAPKSFFYKKVVSGKNTLLLGFSRKMIFPPGFVSEVRPTSNKKNHQDGASKTSVNLIDTTPRHP